jgi:hypothetical protein
VSLGSMRYPRPSRRRSDASASGADGDTTGGDP